MLKGVDVSMVSRGDSTLRGHFPGDLAALEAGMGGEEQPDRIRNTMALYSVTSRASLACLHALCGIYILYIRICGKANKRLQTSMKRPHGVDWGTLR